jgi:hypothetical protein
MACHAVAAGTFRSLDETVSGLLESFAQGFHQQLVFAFEVLVEASVGQAGVAHHSRNRAAPVMPSARTRRAASFTIFRWISALYPGP